jgi:hypothetical protein
VSVALPRIPVRGTGDELDHLAASLNAMLERNEAAMESEEGLADPDNPASTDCDRQYEL